MLKRIIAILAASLTISIFSQLGTPEGCAITSGAFVYLLSIQILNKIKKRRPELGLDRSFVQLMES